MKLWIDDVRPAPEGYVWIKSVNDAKRLVLDLEERVSYWKNKGNDAFLKGNHTFRTQCYKNANKFDIDLIDIDHDAGDFAQYGGDYIKLLDWLEETGRNYPIHIHSMNPIGVQNMRAIIQKNGWKEIRY